jgi:hypothetical protein
MRDFEYTVVHVNKPGRDNKALVGSRTEKVRAGSPAGATLPYRGKQMTRDEILALKEKK